MENSVNGDAHKQALSIGEELSHHCSILSTLTLNSALHTLLHIRLGSTPYTALHTILHTALHTTLTALY